MKLSHPTRGEIDVDDRWINLCGGGWSEPDLDRGLIESLTLSDAEVAKLPKATVKKVYEAAERWAEIQDQRGICVLAEEWVVTGSEWEWMQTQFKKED